MELTDIMKEEEKQMKKNEKRVIIILGVAIAIVAIALIAMLITSRDTSSTSNPSTTSLKDAVQEESNNKNNDNDGQDVSDKDNTATEQPTTEKPTTEKQTEAATTEASKKNTTSASEIMDADDGYVFPDADTTYISKSSIKKLSDSELQYAVNEIYARHGLKFTKTKNKERFEKKAWYVGTVDNQDDISLNKYEKKNVDKMAAELKKRGLR